MIASKIKSSSPGLGISFGLSVLWLGLIVLIPLGAMLFKTMDIGWSGFWKIVLEPRSIAAFKVSFGIAFLAALINVPIGLYLAWVLSRYSFPGRRLLDSLVDLPFALPTAVAGITLTAIYGPNGLVGQHLEAAGIKVAYALPGIFLALQLIGIPFVVRSTQPIIMALEKELEEAAASLGASPFTTFRKIIFPAILPALLTGFSLAFARGVGEYGSVVFISGNMPMQTEIVPLLILSKLEQYDYLGATALGSAMLIVSFGILAVLGLFERWQSRLAGK